MDGTDLLLSVGGDGTILRVARVAVPWSIPILGINMGHLGFMTELGAEDALKKLPLFLESRGWVEERVMLRVEIVSPGEGVSVGPGSKVFDALNDVVVGRSAISRVVHVETYIDGGLLTTYRADGIIVATATGSTGYSLAAGGPILYPQSKDLLIKPISPHLSMGNALILPSTTEVELRVRTGHQAMISVDGQIDLELQSGAIVRVMLGPHCARFLRANPASHFFTTLTKRLAYRE